MSNDFAQSDLLVKVKILVCIEEREMSVRSGPR